MSGQSHLRTATSAPLRHTLCQTSTTSQPLPQRTLVMGLSFSWLVTFEVGVRQMAAVTPLLPSGKVKQHCCGDFLLGLVTNVDRAAEWESDIAL